MCFKFEQGRLTATHRTFIMMLGCLMLITRTQNSCHSTSTNNHRTKSTNPEKYVVVPVPHRPVYLITLLQVTNPWPNLQGMMQILLHVIQQLQVICNSLSKKNFGKRDISLTDQITCRDVILTLFVYMMLHDN